MDVTKLATAILNATGREEKFRELIEQSALDACSEVLSNWQWPFLKVEGSTVSVSGTREYTLTGTNNNLGVLSYVQYDDTPLEFISDAMFDQKNAPINASASDVAFWRFVGQSAEGNPVVQLFGTPDKVATIFYRGFKKIPETDPFLLLQAGMNRIIRLMLLEEYHPNPDSQQRYAFRVEKAIDNARWAWRDKDAKVLPFPISPDKRARNVEINSRRGSVGRASGVYRIIG